MNNLDFTIVALLSAIVAAQGTALWMICAFLRRIVEIAEAWLFLAEDRHDWERRK